MSTPGNKRKHTCKTVSLEEREFTWKVDNFREMIGTATNDMLYDDGYIFDAGDSIELPSTWKIYLKKGPNNILGIIMKLLKAPDEVEKVKASFNCKTLKYDDCEDADWDEYLPQASWGWESAFFSLDNFSEDNLVNGSLEIDIKFSLHKDIPEDEYKRVKFEQESRDAAVGDFQNILDSGEDTDVTLEMADGKTLKTHAAILKGRSRVFLAMLVTDMQESASRIIRIEDVSHQVMKRILTFIYTGKVGDKWEEVVEELVYAANKYELLVLLRFFDDNLATTCKPDNVWDRLAVAKRHELKTAQGQIAEYIKSHIDEVLQIEIES